MARIFIKYEVKEDLKQWSKHRKELMSVLKSQAENLKRRNAPISISRLCFSVMEITICAAGFALRRLEYVRTAECSFAISHISGLLCFFVLFLEICSELIADADIKHACHQDEESHKRLNETLKKNGIYFDVSKRSDIPRVFDFDAILCAVELLDVSTGSGETRSIKDTIIKIFKSLYEEKLELTAQSIKTRLLIQARSESFAGCLSLNVQELPNSEQNIKSTPVFCTALCNMVVAFKALHNIQKKFESNIYKNLKESSGEAESLYSTDIDKIKEVLGQEVIDILQNP